MLQQRLCSSSGPTQHQTQSPSPRFSSFTWSSECFDEKIFLIWSKQDTTPMFFKEISKELCAVRLSGMWGGALTVTKVLRGGFSARRSLRPLGFAKKHSYLFYIMFFLPLAVSTDRKQAQEVSSVLLFSGHPPHTHPMEDTRTPPPWSAHALFHQHLLLPPWGIVFISTVFLLWVSHVPRHVLLGFSWSAVTSLSKERVGSIWEQTPFHTNGNSQFPQASWQTVALVINCTIHFEFVLKT